MLSNYNSINVDNDTNTNTRKKSDRNYLWIGSIIFGITLIIIIITIVIDGNNNNNTYSNHFSNIFDNIDSNNNNVETGETGETGETVGRELVSPYIDAEGPGWLATGQLSDLSDGDEILIRHLRTSGLLKTRHGVDKVTARDTTFLGDRRFSWIVGYSQSKDAYTFKNRLEHCYLKYDLQYDSGNLKCLYGLNGDNGYWKSGGFDHLDRDVSSYPRYSTILKNSGNNKCPRVGSYHDDSISMKNEHCNDYDDAGFVFEILSKTIKNLDGSKYEQNSNEYTWVVAEKLGIGLSSGDIIAIRSAYTSGLINNPSNSNTVESTVTYDSDSNLWIVGYDESDDVYTLQSLEDNCYLQFRDGYLKCRSTLDDKSYWILDGCNGQSCIVLKNDYNGKWVKTRGPLHNQYESPNWYGPNCRFRFEVVHHV